jgi:[histone H3]-lysine4 N-trimethyltransferase SETD1
MTAAYGYHHPAYPAGGSPTTSWKKPAVEEENWDTDVHDAKKGADKKEPASLAAVKNNKNALNPEDEDNIHSAVLDLDTRIAMMFKTKPPFLQLASDDEEDEKSSRTPEIGKTEEVGDADAPQPGTPPSPFLSKAAYEEARKASKPRTSKKKVADGASDISSSDDEILLAKGTYSPVVPASRKSRVGKVKGGNFEDQLSLSSLSSTENAVKMEEDEEPPPQPPPEPIDDKPPPIPPEFLMQSQPGYLYPLVSQYQAPNPYGAAAGYNYQNKYHEYGYPYMAQYGATAAGAQYGFTPMAYGAAGSYSHHPGAGGKLEPNSRLGGSHRHQRPAQHNPYEQIIKRVVDRVTSELKQILKRDFNKKMIENTAFRKYEAWWDEEERRDKQKDAEVKKESTLENDITPLTQALPAAAKEKPADEAPKRESLDFGGTVGFGTLGLGFRAAMPKMPSFRRIRKDPSPVPENAGDTPNTKNVFVDEDDEDMVHRTSDTEEVNEEQDKTIYSRVPTATAAATTPSRDRKRKGSTSSFFSSSSEDDSSSGQSDEDDEFSSDENMLSDSEVERAKQPAPPPKDAKRIYSDTDDDSDGELNIPTSALGKAPTPGKSKLGIYSDTDSDEEAKSTETAKPVEVPPLPPPPPISNDMHDLSDFSPDDTSALPRTPGREVDDQDTTPPKPATPPPPAPAPAPEPKKFDLLERVYSDSDEEREYLERRRRNTEYMEQVDREAAEEVRRMREEAAKRTQQTTPDRKPPALESVKTAELMKTSSMDDPSTPSLSRPPPTPGAKLDDPLAKFMEAKEQSIHMRYVFFAIFLDYLTGDFFIMIHVEEWGSPDFCQNGLKM